MSGYLTHRTSFITLRVLTGYGCYCTFTQCGPTCVVQPVMVVRVTTVRILGSQYLNST